MREEHKKCLLIVEDLEEWQDILCELLQDDYELLLSKTLQEAVERLEKDSFDLAILDLRLEDRDRHNVKGLQLLKSIKEQSPEIPVIILTGHINSVKKPENLNHCTVVLKDSFNNEHFKETIVILLEGKGSSHISC